MPAIQDNDSPQITVVRGLKFLVWLAKAIYSWEGVKIRGRAIYFQKEIEIGGHVIRAVKLNFSISR